MTEKRDKASAIVKVKPYSYQPSKAELEADVSIPASPENLARKILRQVTAVKVKNA